jgi:6-pyruvoyl-tetrahydropterin synthase
MTTEVARRYRFRGKHHLPGFPEPWCEVHEHDYTVEVVAVSPVGDVHVDTDRIDQAWRFIKSDTDGPYDLDAFGPENTTVEALAQRWLRMFRYEIPSTVQVSVWEDDDRWGRATW